MHPDMRVITRLICMLINSIQITGFSENDKRKRTPVKMIYNAYCHAEI